MDTMQKKPQTGSGIMKAVKASCAEAKEIVDGMHRDGVPVTKEQAKEITARVMHTQTKIQRAMTR